jgi:hypothetical protein
MPWISVGGNSSSHNQGIRYVLAGCLLRQDNDSALKELLAAYEDGNASWLYTRALVAFRENGDGDGHAAALVRDAWSANEHVPRLQATPREYDTGDEREKNSADQTRHPGWPIGTP